MDSFGGRRYLTQAHITNSNMKHVFTFILKPQSLSSFITFPNRTALTAYFLERSHRDDLLFTRPKTCGQMNSRSSQANTFQFALIVIYANPDTPYGPFPKSPVFIS